MSDKKRVEIQLPTEALVTMAEDEDVPEAMADDDRPDSPEQDSSTSALRRVEDTLTQIRWLLMIIAVAVIIFDVILGIAFAISIINRP